MKRKFHSEIDPFEVYVGLLMLALVLFVAIVSSIYK